MNFDLEHIEEYNNPNEGRVKINSNFDKINGIILSGTNNYFPLTGGTIYGDIIPDGDGTRDLGSPTHRWREIYVSGGTIHIGDSAISSSDDTIELSNKLSCKTVAITEGAQAEQVLLSINENGDTAWQPAVELWGDVFQVRNDIILEKNYTELYSLQLKDKDNVKELRLPYLTTCTSDFICQDNASLDTIYCPILESVHDLTYLRNNSLTGISFNALTTMNDLSIGSNHSLTGISFDALTAMDDLSVYSNDSLTGISFDLLESLDSLDISSNASLTDFSFNALTTMNDLSIGSNNSLTDFSFNALTTMNDLSIGSNNS